MKSILDALENHIEELVLQSITTPHRLASVVHCAIAMACAYDAWDDYYMYCQH